MRLSRTPGNGRQSHEARRRSAGRIYASIPTVHVQGIGRTQDRSYNIKSLDRTLLDKKPLLPDTSGNSGFFIGIMEIL